LFAHIYWLVERNTNRSIPRNYGKGVFEGMWLGIVTASTVGAPPNHAPRQTSGTILGASHVTRLTYETCCLGGRIDV